MDLSHDKTYRLELLRRLDEIAKEIKELRKTIADKLGLMSPPRNIGPR